MKKIFIHAYTETNLGDDLFVKILCERYPQHQFYIICRKTEAEAFLKIKNLKVIYSIPYLDAILFKLSLEHIYINRVVRKCDLIVHIGGSLFIEPRVWQNHVKRYRNRIKTNKPFYIVGSNFGPYTSKGFYEGYKEIFSEVMDVCFRDEYSYKLFRELENTRLATDAVFTLDVDKIIKRDLTDSIVISVINLKNRPVLTEHKESYEKKIAEITIQLINKGYNVILMSFCEKEGDLETSNEIRNKIPSSIRTNAKTYNYSGNLEESLSIIKSSKGIIATRFHSLILGWLFHLPVYPLIYSPKTENVLNDSEYTGNSTWIQKIDKIEASTVVSQITKNTKFKIGKEIQRAQNQFLELDKILK